MKSTLCRLGDRTLFSTQRQEGPGASLHRTPHDAGAAGHPELPSRAIPVHVVLGGELADGGNDGVEPPDGIPLDGCDLVLEGAQHLEVWGRRHLVSVVTGGSTRASPDPPLQAKHYEGNRTPGPRRAPA